VFKILQYHESHYDIHPIKYTNIPTISETVYYGMFEYTHTLACNLQPFV